MAVNLDQEAGKLSPHRADHPRDGAGLGDPGHVLDAEALIRATGIKQTAFDQGLDESDIVFRCVEGAFSVAGADLVVAPGLAHETHGILQVPGVVHGIKGAEDVDAGAAGFVDEGAQDVVGDLAVANTVLAPEKHLEGGVACAFLEALEILPRVFGQVAQGGVEGGAAPNLEREKARLVDLGESAQRHLVGHAGGPEGLVGVPEGGVSYLDLRGIQKALHFHCETHAVELPLPGWLPHDIGFAAQAGEIMRPQPLFSKV